MAIARRVAQFSASTFARCESLAGERSFARGKDYDRNGQVRIIGIEAQRVLAQVAGTDDYRTELRGRGKTIDGDCSCPAFEDRGFCKHMVAAALAANAAGDDAEAEGAGVLARIKDHLKARAQMHSWTWSWICQSGIRPCSASWTLPQQRGTPTTRRSNSRLRRAIDDATRTRGFVDYGEAASWATGVEEALDAVADLAQDHRAGLALRLVVHAMARNRAGDREHR